MQAVSSPFIARTFNAMAAAAILAVSLGGASVAMASSHAAKAPMAADVQVDQAWIRATVKGQMGTGGFMTLTSTKGATLVGFSSSAAKANQIHEMAMEGDVMRMREIPALPLPAGQAVALKPGGFHLMLVKLKKTLKAGDKVPVTLKFKDAQGRVFSQKLNVPVQQAAAAASPAAAASSPDAGHAHH